jgi:hypothetical protein
MPANRLNASKRREIDAICAQWLSRANCTDPIDEARCRGAATKAYALEGLATPAIVFCSSPIEAMSRLQSHSPDANSRVPRPVPDPQKVLEDGTSFAGVWDVMVAAQPKVWPTLGREVALSFHIEVFAALDWIPWGSETWPPVKRRVESRVFDLCHLAHTVTDALEKIVTVAPEAWLLYTQGAGSLWAEAHEYAALETALALGHVHTPPAALAAGRELLASCGWIYSFERLCLICDRPADIQQSKHKREVRTCIKWRDGVQCDRVFS